MLKLKKKQIIKRFNLFISSPNIVVFKAIFVLRMKVLGTFFMKASSNHNPIKHNKNLGLISKAL